MTVIDFLKYFFATKAYGLKVNIQSIIAIQFEDEDSAGMFKKYPGAVYVEGGKFKAIVDGVETIIDGNVNNPLVYMDSLFDFPEDFHPVLGGVARKSTFGNMLFNIVLFWESFGSKVAYQNKKLTDKVITGILADLMVDNPKPGEELPPGKASVDECLKLSTNANFLHGLSIHFVKPGGVDAFTVDPKILKRKDELFKLHKDELNDPIVFNNIVKELVDMDIEIQMNGPSRNFFIKDKFITTARKRMFIAFGIEPNADGTGYIGLPASLDQGIDPEYITTYINAAISGSYSRAMATGDGGSKVKETLRLIGRVKPVMPDCGSTVGERIMFETKDQVKNWVDSFFIDKGKVKQITKDMFDSLVGKTVYMRVPPYCLVEDGNYCITCLGLRLGALKDRIGSEVTRIPTNFMLQRMKEHHSSGKVNTVLKLSSILK